MWDKGGRVESLGISTHLMPRAQADALGLQGDGQAWAESGGIYTFPFPVWGVPLGCHSGAALEGDRAPMLTELEV